MVTVARLAPRLRAVVARLSIARLLSAGLWLAGLAGLLAGLALWRRAGFAPPAVTFVTPAVLLGEMVVALAYASVGWLLAASRPRNPIGWLFLGIGVATAIQIPVIVLGGGFSGPLGPDAAPTIVAAWLASSLHLPFVGTLGIVAFLVFPDGRPLAPRWAAAAWLAAIGALAVSVAVALAPGPLLWYRTIPNPFPAPAWAAGPLWIMGLAGGIAFVAALLLAGWSMVVRYRLSSARRRLQLRWIAVAVVLLTASAAPFLAVRYLMEVPYDVASLLAALLVLAAGTFPVAAAIAILRHRLFDVDLILNRTIVYLPLSAILTALFGAMASLVQRVFVALTGDPSDIAFFLATIVVAITITPLHQGLQSVADRYVKPAAAERAKGRRRGARARDEHGGEELEAVMERVLHRLEHLERRLDGLDPTPDGQRTGERG